MSVLNETLLTETVKEIFNELDSWEFPCYNLHYETKNYFEQCFENDDEIVDLEAEDEDYFKAVDEIKETLEDCLFSNLEHDDYETNYLARDEVVKIYESNKELAKKNLA